MELLEQMTPEGLEKYLLLDGAVVSLEELRGMVSQPPSVSSKHDLEFTLPILRVVHVLSAR